MQLYDTQGQRLYFTESERMVFLETAHKADRKIRTICMTLTYTGCRISETLNLTYKSIDFAEKAVIFINKWYKLL